MKIVIVLAVVIASSLAASVRENDINYYFYCRRNPSGRIIHVNEIVNNATLEDVFDPKLETVMLFHGWKDNYGAESNTEVRSALLSHYNVNVIKVDWGPIAGKNYLSAKNSVPTVGRFAANMLRKLNKLYNYSYQNVTIIGFSLGAHAAGNVGADLDGQIDQIFGLDPAGPLISYKDTDYSLDPTDAKFVTVIHTNTAFLGMTQPIGHSDYYPNGGDNQPGCGLMINNACAHNRAWAYLVESFGPTNGFVAQRCSKYRDYTRGRCSGEYSVMGGFPADKTARGSYYLDTNRRAPYALG